MTKPLKDGEKRTYSTSDGVLVTAERVDSDTPFITIKEKDTGAEITLTDSGAKSLIEVLGKALRVLPTSK